MAESWAAIDARAPCGAGLTHATRVAGLSLIARHARTAARCGYRGAVIRVGDQATRDALTSALDAQPPPADFAVEFTEDEVGADGPERTFVALDLHAVYSRPALAEAAPSGTSPEPLVTVTSRDDVARAQKLLFAQIRKTVDQGGIFAVYTQRPISRLFTRLLLDTRVTPNQVTSSAIVAGVTAAICAAIGGRTGIILAGFFYWFGSVLDCADGELARLRLQSSKAGEWLDSMADEISTFGLMIGLGIGMSRDGFDPSWVHTALVAAAIGIVVHIKLYADLHRMGSHIDSAQYPWFFGKPSEGGAGPRRGLGKLFYWITPMFRRDAFVTFVAVLLISGVRIGAVLLLAGGVAVVATLFVIHHTVLLFTARQR